MSDSNIAPGSELPKLYTTKEVAEIFNVTAETVRNWILTGQLHAKQTPGHQYRIPRQDVLNFARSHYGVETL